MVDHLDARGIKRTAHRLGSIRGPQGYDRDLRGGAKVGHDPLENFIPVEGVLEDIIYGIT